MILALSSSFNHDLILWCPNANSYFHLMKFLAHISYIAKLLCQLDKYEFAYELE